MSRLVFLDQPLFAALKVRNGFRSNAALARTLGVSGEYVRQIGNGYLPSEALRLKIAEALSVRVDALWRACPPTEVAA
jgi:DNA-binding XRE family transcriptional regulator